AGVAQQIYDYFDRAIDDHIARPRDDVLSAMIAADIAGQPLSREELLDICFLFLIAGLDTVTDSLDCFFVYLARHPDHRHQLVEQPDVLPSAIEELLRWETPVPGVARVAIQDVEVGGCPIGKGERVSPLLGAANTDPDEFADPELVDFTRNPNRHRAFGGGPHRCLGSHLARMELRVALREFHRRIPDYEIKPGTQLNYTAALRSVESLPLIFAVR
ncbi:MAG: cytochrome P450, partial [Mycobacterium sp.]